MSFGALSASAKEALGRAATEVGTSTTTGDGGMTPEERKASDQLVYQVLPSRYGFDPADLRQADAVEIVVGQGAKPGGGGLLLGQKVNERVAAMRTLPPGIDQRSASRHPDWVGPDDLRIKIEELREATDWTIPVYVKIGATRVDHDVKLAVAAGADVVVVDGMQGGTAATQDVFIEHAGIPTLPAVRMAAEALRDIGMRDEVQLVVSGGIRSGADVAKALALGADAVSIGVAALLALGCNRATYRNDAGTSVDVSADYAALGTEPGSCAHCHTGRCPVGITTQDASARGAARSRPRRHRGGQLPPGPHHGGDRAGPGLREVQRAPPRARGSRRAHGGGRRHGPGPSGRHRLDPGLAHLSVRGFSPHGRGRGDRWRRGRASARPGPWSSSGVTDVLVLERDTVGSGGSGKSSGIVRCHYGIPSLAAMAWRALPVLEHAAEILGAPSGYTQDGLPGRGRATEHSARSGPTSPCSSALGIDGRAGRPRGGPARCGRPPASTTSPSSPTSPTAVTATGTRRRWPSLSRLATAGRRLRQHTAVAALGRHGRQSPRRASWRTAAASVPPTSSWRPGPGRSPWPPASASTCPCGPSGPRSSSSTQGGRSGRVPVFSDLVSLQYVRTEGTGQILLGDSDHSDPEWSDPDCYRERVNDDELATAIPKFAHRFPGFDGASLASSYAGCYDVTPDYNPIISAAPIDGLWLCAGFSGHGYKISPSAGELMADLITTGASRHPDIRHRDFRWERFAEDEPLVSPHPYVGAGQMR